ncbi:MAG: DUF393 domain-containing protein [Planctomycetes bacterium]|nr:DUF393 domain-containing protein [Planctomycetota bacterium]
MPDPVLFFDGTCGLCNRFIQFLFAVDKGAVFKVTPLQGTYAREKLPESLTKVLSTLVVLTPEGKTLTKSAAVLYVLRKVGGPWKPLAALGEIFPARFSDRIYDEVARRRFQLFGKRDSCAFPRWRSAPGSSLSPGSTFCSRTPSGRLGKEGNALVRIKKAIENFRSRKSEDFEWSAAAVRIAVAIGSLMMARFFVLDDYAAFLSHFPIQTYEPKGILAILFPESPPSARLLTSLVPTTLAATLLALVGLLTPLSWAVALAGSLILTGVLFSFGPGASHGYNLILLTQAAMIFVPATRFSLDGWILGRLGKRHTPGRWLALRIMLVQVTVSCMYLGAVLTKLRAGGWGFEWIRADNFRAHLIRRYPLLGEDFPAHVAWIADREWVCFLLPLFNVFAQFSPFLACFLFPWPRLRLLFGIAFPMEVVGLGVMMGLWDFHLIPLFAAFVDWDYFFRSRTKDAASIRFADSQSRGTRIGALSAGAMLATVAVILGVAVHPNPKIETERNLYPLSNFPMYSRIFAPGEISLANVEFEFQAPIVAQEHRMKTEKAFQRQLNDAVDWTDQSVVRERLEYLSRAISGWQPEEIRAYRAYYRFPEFPSPYERILVQRDWLGTWTPHGIKVAVKGGTQSSSSGR